MKILFKCWKSTSLVILQLSEQAKYYNNGVFLQIAWNYYFCPF